MRTGYVLVFLYIVICASTNPLATSTTTTTIVTTTTTQTTLLQQHILLEERDIAVVSVKESAGVCGGREFGKIKHELRERREEGIEFVWVAEGESSQLEREREKEGGTKSSGPALGG